MSGRLKVAQSKKTSGKKNTGKSKPARTQRRSPAPRKKAKVRMNLKGVVCATLVIVLACAAVMAFTYFFFMKDSGKPDVEQGPFVEVPDSNAVKPENRDSEKKGGTGETPKPEDKSSGKDEPVYELVPEEDVSPDLPIETDDKEEKKSGESEGTAYSFPDAKNGAKICFVIDDGGQNVENVRRYAELPFPLTIAVLPKLPKTRECADAVIRGGKELILHQPMQAHDYSSGKTPDPGPGAILPEMDYETVSETVRGNLSEIGKGVKGMNNHEGSLITESHLMMDAVLSVAEDEEVYFLDSRTTSVSAVQEASRSRGMKYIARFAPFLDNVIDRNSMLSELKKGLAVANRDGYAVIIGHVDKSVGILPDLLSEVGPELVKKGYVLTTPSALGVM